MASTKKNYFNKEVLKATTNYGTIYNGQFGAKSRMSKPFLEISRIDLGDVHVITHIMPRWYSFIPNVSEPLWSTKNKWFSKVGSKSDHFMGSGFGNAIVYCLHFFLC